MMLQASSPRPENASVADWLASLPTPEQSRLLKELAATPAEERALEHEWQFWGRPKQFAPPGDWTTWLILAGRGFGKTRTGAEWIRDRVERGIAKRIYLVGATAADVRDVMIKGESGLMAVSAPWCMPKYEPSKRSVTWPNGAVAITFSAEEPNRLRGPQADTAWGDELASWKYPDAWDQLQFGLRLGNNPQAVVTTTPRPTTQIRSLIADSGSVITRGTTYENRGNLAATFFSKIVKKYEGTRLGRQELDGDVLDDNPGALFKRTQIDECRVRVAPRLVRVVVAVDPGFSAKEESDGTGIIVAGVGDDGRGYVIEDLSGQAELDKWAKTAVSAYHRFKAGYLVAEMNMNGKMVEDTIRTYDPQIAFKPVRATQGKALRAEPISSLYEQGRISHVGAFAKLEDQMCTWDPTMPMKSPSRLDALVWAFTELMLGDYVAIEAPPARIATPYRQGSGRGF